MSGLLCVWSDVPESAIDWYENTFIGDMTSTMDADEHALHCETTSVGMEGDGIGPLGSPWRWFGVYETNNLKRAKDLSYDDVNWPKDSTLTANPKESCFTTRTYVEHKRWQAEDWDGDHDGIASVAVLEWQPLAEMEETVVDYYIKSVGPCIIKSPDVLRFRLFKAESAKTWENSEQTILEKSTIPTYFTLVELSTDEWPWNVVIDLAEDKNWKKFFEEQTIKWKVGHYLVLRSFPESNSTADSVIND